MVAEKFAPIPEYKREYCKKEGRVKNHQRLGGIGYLRHIGFNKRASKHHAVSVIVSFGCILHAAPAVGMTMAEKPQKP